MRLRLLRRRLTVSAPRVAVRSALPWTVRWLLGALVLGFSAALALWAFEFGRDIAGLDRHAKQELETLRVQVQGLRDELGKAQSIVNTSDSMLTAEKAVQQQLLQQIRQLEADNQTLRSDLGFFERLIPGSGAGELRIRGLQVERVADGQLKWQALMIQAAKNAPEFKGTLELTFAGSMDGKPWTLGSSPTVQPVQVRSYLRLEGMVALPPQAVVKTVTARILQGSTVKSVQTAKL